jgi:SAM-dependent methyltransferase
MRFGAYARYYDLLYRDKPYEDEASYVLELARRSGGATGSLLELGVGTGGHAVHFARTSQAVFGVDMSQAMLDAAEDRKRSLEPSLSARLTLIPGDVRTVRLNQRFSLVVSMFHVASYQTTNDDLMAMFRTARAHLDVGGVFVFDVWYGPGVLTEPPTVRVKRFADANTAVERIAEPALHPRENTVDVNYAIRVTDLATGSSEVIQEQHRMRYLFEPELVHFLSNASLEFVNAVSWMRFEPPTLDDWTAGIIARAV